MSRRTHRKSRNGCMECKRRHVKCEETLPICVNCRTSARACSFTREALMPVSDSAYPSPASNVSSCSCDKFQEHGLQQNQLYDVNLEHMFLLCHFHGQVAKDFQSSDLTQPISDLFGRYVVSAPYLTHQLLAVSALHLSLEGSLQSGYYREYATGLQNQALVIFNRQVTNIEDSNCVPALIFSSLIGLHVLCESIRYHSTNLENFLTAFTHFLSIHSGVRTIAHAAWNNLRQVEILRSHLEVPEKVTQAIDTPGPECARLYEMLEQADLGAKSFNVYSLTVKHLQWTYDATRHAHSTLESKHMLMAWSTLVPSGYVDLLVQQRPEALVILAYYGVLLLKHQDFWVVKGGGAFLIDAIREKLSQYWETWLAWPVAELKRAETLEHHARFDVS